MVVFSAVMLQAPVVTTTPAEGPQNASEIPISITGTVPNNNSDTELVYIIRNVPQGVTFSAGKIY